MQFSAPQQREPQRPYEPAEFAPVQIDLRYLLAVLLWRKWQIALVVLAFIALGLVYLTLRQPSYTAVSQLLIYNNKFAISREDAVYAERQLDTTFIETQIEILNSPGVAARVVDTLKLGAGPTDEPQQQSWLARLRALLPTSEEPETDEGDEAKRRRAQARQMIQSGLKVERVGISYVVAVSFKSGDPEFSARVVNAVVDAFIAEQDKVRLQAAESSSAWLRDRIRSIGPQTRIISRATPPANNSDPGGKLILMLAAIAGSAVAVGLAFGREMLDRTLRSPEHLAVAIDAECFGIVPKLRRSKIARAVPRWAPSEVVLDDEVDHDDEQNHDLTIDDRDPLLSAGVNAPFSRFWNTLRDTHIMLNSKRTRRGPSRIGTTSFFAGEGKTVISVNLARYIASLGHRVLLIDTNPHAPALSQSFGLGEAVGLVDLLENDELEFESAIAVDPLTDLHIMPIGASEDRIRRSHIIWSAALDRMLAICDEAYDYVIFDLPGLACSADAKASAEYIDQFLLVVNWGRVSIDEAMVGMSTAPLVRRKVAGAIMNNVSVGGFTQFPSPGAGYVARGMRTGNRAAREARRRQSKAETV